MGEFGSPAVVRTLVNAEDKFILAIAQVKHHTHRIVPTARRDDPAIELLGELYRSLHPFPCLKL